jgi:hypothetical protein
MAPEVAPTDIGVRFAQIQSELFRHLKNGSRGRIRTYDQVVNPDSSGLYRFSSSRFIHLDDFIALIRFSSFIAAERVGNFSCQAIFHGHFYGCICRE